MEYYPLSKTEEGIYLSCLTKTDSYNLAYLMKLGKSLDIDKFNNVLNEIIKIHPYINTVLFMGDDSKVYKKIVNKNIDLKVREVKTLDIEPEYFDMLDSN